MKYLLVLLLLPKFTLACGLDLGANLFTKQSITEIGIIFFFVLGSSLVITMVLGIIILIMVKVLPSNRKLSWNDVYLKIRKKLLILLALVFFFVLWFAYEVMTNTMCLGSDEIKFYDSIQPII